LGFRRGLKLSGLLGKLGFFEFFFEWIWVFGGKNGVWQVNLRGFGKVGKKKTCKNAQKCAKS